MEFVKNNRGFAIEKTAAIILVIIVVVLLSTTAYRTVQDVQEDILNFIFGLGKAELDQLTELEQAIRCSYYRCTKGCKAVKDMNFGDFKCINFCKEDWVEGENEVICGWNAQQVPVEVSDGGLIRAEKLADVAQCVYDSESNCVWYAPTNTGFVSVYISIENREARSDCAGYHHLIGQPPTPKYRNTIKSGIINRKVYIYTLTGRGVCSGSNNIVTNVSDSPKYITLVPDEKESITIEANKPYRVVVGNKEFIIKSTTSIDGTTPYYRYDGVDVTCPDGSQESSLTQSDCNNRLSKAFCDGYLLIECVNPPSEFKITYLTTPQIIGE